MLMNTNLGSMFVVEGVTDVLVSFSEAMFYEN